MINENYKVISKALNTYSSQKQTIITLGVISLLTGGVIYFMHRKAEQQNDQISELKNELSKFQQANEATKIDITSLASAPVAKASEVTKTSQEEASNITA